MLVLCIERSLFHILFSVVVSSESCPNGTSKDCLHTKCPELNFKLSCIDNFCTCAEIGPAGTFLLYVL